MQPPVHFSQSNISDTSPPALRIISPGILSLLQDAGRFGQGRLGLTQGGPLDAHSFRWANALVGNPINSTLIEHSVGGLILQALAPSTVAVTGAVLSLSCNGQSVPCWQAITLKQGDELALGMFSQGLRAYIAVTGGICVTPHFGSSATVMREGVGGLLPVTADKPLPAQAGGTALAGQKLKAGELLPLSQHPVLPGPLPTHAVSHSIATRSLPGSTALHLRLIGGYQANLFSACQRARFYLNPYQVTPQSDRMGYKLSGSAITAVPASSGYTFVIGKEPMADKSQAVTFNVVTGNDLRWQRCHIKSTSLLGNVLHYQQGVEQGAQEILLFDREGNLTEGAAVNVFVVKNGEIATPPLSNKFYPV
ncbi:aminotransferase class IV [Alishewanella longhuensis]